MTIACQNSLVEKSPYHFFHEEGIALSSGEDQVFNGLQFAVVADQLRHHLGRILTPEWVETQLSVIGLVTPMMLIFGTIVDHHQDRSGTDAVGQKVQQ